ncbi:MAG: hypothetical protein M1365_07525 [Actinobacteria bacterium]|nr:hypothetical protein [Actinomycetota bacterium]
MGTEKKAQQLHRLMGRKQIFASEYILLRGFGRINIFPGDDVGAQKNIKELLDLNERPNYEEIKKLVSRWDPYAGMVYFHLLLNKLEKERLL